MKNLIKKLEEQIAFLQYESLQMSEELYSQQIQVLLLFVMVRGIVLFSL